MHEDLREELIKRFLPEPGDLVKDENGNVTITGKGLGTYRLLQFKHGLRLQARGIHIRSSRSVLKQAHEEGIVPKEIRTALKAVEFVDALEQEVRERFKALVTKRFKEAAGE
jgi:signal peptidase I